MKRYAWLLAFALLAALLLGPLARLAGRSSATARPAPPVPEATLALAIVDDRLAPESSAVPKDHRVRLVVTNRDARARTLTLAGYRDRLAPRTLAPGEVWSATFLADRPGDDFAWLLDGRPAGRFKVLGSHLVEDHR
jgi:hypothetical protein